MSEILTTADAPSKAETMRYAATRRPTPRRVRIYPTLITLALLAPAALISRNAWTLYMDTPWTRDATVRAYVVTIAPEVAGKVVELRVRDNQLVRKGDPLMTIDPINYHAALEQAEANLVRARATADDARKKATRRQQLSDLAASAEERDSYASAATAAEANVRTAQANLNLARADMERTRLVSPVDGYVTNLQIQLGDYATIGEKSIALVDANSFWVDGYFEESFLQKIHEGDAASIRLLGHEETIRGHVESVARGITVANAQTDGSGLATVNPIFTWVRLAQRVPVRIAVDPPPEEARLIAGLTATVKIEPASDRDARK